MTTAEMFNRPERLTAPSAARSEPACPACGGRPTGQFDEIPDHEYSLSYVARFAHCSSCGTTYQDPMPAERDLGGFYPASYHSMTDGGWLMDARRSMRVTRMRKLLRGERGLVLDYGCGNGSFLVAAAKKLPENSYVGFEYADVPSRTTLADGKVVIIKGTIDDLMTELSPVRMLIMNHVIEHLPDPSSVLSKLRRRMVDGAIFDGQTPNADSTEHRLFGRRWSGYHAPRHTVVFSRSGLRRFLESHGFRDVVIHGAFNPAGVAVSLGSLPHGHAAGRIVRKGLGWQALVGVASLLMPLDLLSDAPGMIDFRATAAGAPS